MCPLVTGKAIPFPIVLISDIRDAPSKSALNCQLLPYESEGMNDVINTLISIRVPTILNMRSVLQRLGNGERVNVNFCSLFRFRGKAHRSQNGQSKNNFKNYYCFYTQIKFWFEGIDMRVVITHYEYNVLPRNNDQ